MELKKAVILALADDEKFLPLAQTVPVELWPLVGQPLVQYSLEEAKAAGIEQFIFATSPEKKSVADYFKHSPKAAQGRVKEEIERLKEFQKNVSITAVCQKKSLGDGHALLKTERKIRKEPFVVVFPDEIVDSLVPCLIQLWEVFRTCQRPILALRPFSPQDLFSEKYIGVEVEKIAHRFFKVKKIARRVPENKNGNSWAVVGRFLLVPEVFDYLKKQRPSPEGQITLLGALKSMLLAGKLIYGYEFKGNWLGVYDKLGWLEANFYLALKHPGDNEKLKKYLQKIK